MPTFTNKATLSYNGRTTDSNTVTGNYAEAITVTKTALSDSYSAGDKITYVVSIANIGGSTVSELTVTDDLGGYLFGANTVYPLTYVDCSALYLINGTPQGAPTVTATQPLTFSGITVPAGGNAVIVYEAEINEFAPLDVDGTIANTVTVSGVSIPEDVTATEVVETVDGPELSIVKSLSPQTVTENGMLTYTFDIINVGNTPAVATDNLTVTDLFDPILTISSVTLDGAPLALDKGYTYDETTGLFETVTSVITVPAATYEQNPDGSYTTTPGTAVLRVSGTI